MVSEAGFMMDDETLHLIIGHFKELRNDISGAKKTTLKPRLRTV
jgi:hypothetical protein